MSSNMGDILEDLTVEQKVILNQLRKNLEDIITSEHTDYMLVKFLRAKNFNLKESERTFRLNFYNRITFGVDKLLETYEKPEVIKHYESIGILGLAKDGTPLLYSAIGRIDLYGFIMSVSLYDLCIYFSYWMEFFKKLMKDENQRTGKNIQEITFILDLEEFSLKESFHQCIIEMGVNFTACVQDCYPDIWSNILVINTPTVFDKVFNIFKPFLRAQITDKLRVSDKSSSKDLLLKYIDEDVLPAFLGGKRLDSKGDPKCKEFITFGGQVAESFYSNNNRILLMPTDPTVNCLIIGARSEQNVSLVVTEHGSKLKIVFRTEGGSIAGTIFFKELDFPAKY